MLNPGRKNISSNEKYLILNEYYTGSAGANILLCLHRVRQRNFDWNYLGKYPIQEQKIQVLELNEYSYLPLIIFTDP